MTLSVQQLSGGYGVNQVLFDVNFSIGEGEVVCLMGRNGMGKTTTVHSILGLLPKKRGQVTFQGVNITDLSADQIARLGVGLVPEGRHIFPNLSLHENLVATAANRCSAPIPCTVDRIYEIFPKLYERRSSAGNVLSGGEQQMLAIGRALMTNPRLLVLDEATEGLAPLIRAQIWQCLTELRRTGLAILIVDKHLKKLLHLADRFYVMERGHIKWSGTAKDIGSDLERVSELMAV
jgi:branched-chain amino acid transport system ATP-binding protein